MITYDAMAAAKPGDVVLSVDCDAQWFKPLTAISGFLPELELVCQMDAAPEPLCGGFMRMRVTPATVALCKGVVDGMSSPQAGHATHWINRLALEMNISHGTFPLEMVWATVGIVWSNGMALPQIPANLVAQHCSYVTGMENKIALMKLVRSQIG